MDDKDRLIDEREWIVFCESIVRMSRAFCATYQSIKPVKQRSSDERLVLSTVSGLRDIANIITDVILAQNDQWEDEGWMAKRRKQARDIANDPEASRYGTYVEPESMKTTEVNCIKDMCKGLLEKCENES